MFERKRSAAQLILALGIATSSVSIHAPASGQEIYALPRLQVLELTTADPNTRQQVVQRLVLFRRYAIGVQYFDQRFKPIRLATAYYHLDGPAGTALSRFRWFNGTQESSDARLPASLVGLSSPSIAPLPLTTLMGVWSEPPIAVLGAAAGTPACYARPFQHMHFYEQNALISSLTLPVAEKGPLFTFIADAQTRGALLRLELGSPRRLLEQKGGVGYYHLMLVETYEDSIFSIRKDLCTREGMAECFAKLAPKGILCYHTSNRCINVEPVLIAAANNRGLAWLSGHDMKPARELGRFTSSWLMVARDQADLRELAKQNQIAWRTPPADNKYLWTDDGPQSLRGLVRRDPIVEWLRAELFDRIVIPLRLWGVREPYDLADVVGESLNWLNEFLLAVRDY